MKKLIVLLVCIAFVAGLVLVSQDEVFAAWGRKKDEGKKEEKKEEVVEAAETETAEVVTEKEELLYTFKNDNEMAEFEQFYIQKQATFGRMGVLQAYFAMEQNNLAQIDNQMEEKFGFKMDPSKIYDLNRDTNEIREAGPIAAPAPVE